MPEYQVYYWPILGRANAAIRMLEEAKADYEVVTGTDMASTSPKMAAMASAFGAETANFAPPILVHGDKAISQTVAITTYLGEKLGFNKGIDCSGTALQHLLNIADLQTELGKQNETGPTLKAFLTAEEGKQSRFDKWVATIERAIKGPYFYGETATYVDFAMTASLDWMEGMTFDRIKAQTGVCYLAKATKIKAVAAGIRGLDSYKNYTKMILKPPAYGVKEETIALAFQGGRIKHVADKAGISKAVAAMVAEKSAAAIKARGKFTVAFSGGSLPGIVCAGLAELKDVDYSKWHVFWADERCLPWADKESNYGAVKAGLLDKVAIDPKNVHAIDESLIKDPAAAAKAYEADMKTVFGDVDWPVIDMCLLGMGPDGHTCSLFPGHALLKEKGCWIAPIFDSPKPPPTRITLTLPVVNNSDCIAFVCTGDSKAECVKDIFTNPDTQFPSGLVMGKKGVHWFMDPGAAAGI